MPPHKKRRRDGPLWKVLNAEESERQLPEWKGNFQEEIHERTPIEYFRDFFDDYLLDYIVEQSNLYAIQKDPTKPLNLDRQELEQFFPLCF